MTPKHLLRALRSWAGARRSRVPSLIAAACFAAAGLLALSQSLARRERAAAAAADVAAAAHRDEAAGRRDEVLDKLDRILARLADEP